MISDFRESPPPGSRMVAYGFQPLSGRCAAPPATPPWALDNFRESDASRIPGHSVLLGVRERCCVGHSKELCVWEQTGPPLRPSHSLHVCSCPLYQRILRPPASAFLAPSEPPPQCIPALPYPPIPQCTASPLLEHHNDAFATSPPPPFFPLVVRGQQVCAPAYGQSTCSELKGECKRAKQNTERPAEHILDADPLLTPRWMLGSRSHTAPPAIPMAHCGAICSQSLNDCGGCDAREGHGSRRAGPWTPGQRS